MPFHGTFQALAASLDVELWKAMEIAHYARLHPAHPDLPKMSNDIPDRSGQSEDLANRLEPDNTCALCGQEVPREDCELKPCPFCGQHPVLQTDPADNFFVECLGCFVATSEYLTKARAITIWNTRVTPQSSGFTTEFMLLVLENQLALIMAMVAPLGFDEDGHGALTRRKLPTQQAIDRLREATDATNT